MFGGIMDLEGLLIDYEYSKELFRENYPDKPVFVDLNGVVFKLIQLNDLIRGFLRIRFDGGVVNVFLDREDDHLICTCYSGNLVHVCHFNEDDAFKDVEGVLVRFTQQLVLKYGDDMFETGL